MKKLPLLSLLLVFFSIASHSFAQNRTIINGRVLVPEGEDADGITIFNKNLGRGTVTRNNGDFDINAGVNDSLVFSSVQFDEFTIVMNRELVELGTLTINLNRSLNDLPEVRISNLSGVVEVDVERIRTVENSSSMVSRIEMRNLANMPTRYRANYVRNDAMENRTATDYQGLNFANIFKSVFGLWKEEGRSEKLSRQQIADVLYYDLGENFFVETLNIKKENTNDFILYVIDSGLDQEKLENINTLETMQYFFDQKENYRPSSN